MLTYCNGPKVKIKLLKISHFRILFLVSLLFVAVVNPYSVFKFLILNQARASRRPVRDWFLENN